MMDLDIELPRFIDNVPPPGMALVEELDKTLLIQLRDGRKLIGIMRSFDQFANIVLEGTKIHELASFEPTNSLLTVSTLFHTGARERIIVGNQFGEVDLGLHLVRGENVVLLGELDIENDPAPNLERVSEAEIKRARKAEQEADKMKGLLRSRFDFLDGME